MELFLKNAEGHRFYMVRAETSQDETITVTPLTRVIGALLDQKATAAAPTYTWATNVITYTNVLTDQDVNGIVWGD